MKVAKKTISIFGIFLNHYSGQAGNRIINVHIHADKYIKDLEKYVKDDGHCYFIVKSKPKDIHGNDFGCLLYTFNNYKEQMYEPTNKDSGVFVKYYSCDKGCTVIDMKVNIEVHKPYIQKYINENGYCSFLIEEDIYDSDVYNWKINIRKKK